MTARSLCAKVESEYVGPNDHYNDDSGEYEYISIWDWEG